MYSILSRLDKIENTLQTLITQDPNYRSSTDHPSSFEISFKQTYTHGGDLPRKLKEIFPNVDFEGLRMRPRKNAPRPHPAATSN